MNSAKLYSVVCRIFFFGAFLLFALSVLEKMASLLGLSFLSGLYTAGRLFEFASLLLVFVIALLLREIREELKQDRPRGNQ